jgi:hypothetical protein
LLFAATVNGADSSSPITIARRAYELCDPRRAALSQSESQTGEERHRVINGSGAGDEIEGEKSPFGSVAALSSVDAKDFSRLVQFSPDDYKGSVAPLRYCRVHSFRGKDRGIRQFDYSVYNTTDKIGFENYPPNVSYVNALLQLLFNIPEFRAAAVSSQLSRFQQMTANTIWIELGFLFHMMKEMMSVSVSSAALCSAEVLSQMKVVSASNIQSVLRNNEEAIALGLFDQQANPSSDSAVDSQHFSQVFGRFLLQQLSREVDAEAKYEGRPNMVDELFGFSIETTTTFLSSGTVERQAALIRSTALELSYPFHSLSAARRLVTAHSQQRQSSSSGGGTSSGGSGSTSSISFSALLHRSIRREARLKGWCSASEAYEPLLQVKFMKSIPKLLMLLCGDTQVY